jgi:hypothetical protein
MPTQGEIDDVLTKAATVRTTKVVFDAAVVNQNDAIGNVSSARAAWDAAVGAGTAPELLEGLLNNLIDAEVSRAARATELEAAQSPYGEAQSELQTATDALIAAAISP